MRKPTRCAPTVNCSSASPPRCCRWRSVISCSDAMTDSKKISPAPLHPEAVGAHGAPGEGPEARSRPTTESSSGASRHLLPQGEGKAAALHATTVLHAGTWDSARASDRITLDYEGRHRRRYRYIAEGGLEFVLDLKQTTLLHDGDGIRLDDGRVVLVRAAPE